MRKIYRQRPDINVLINSSKKKIIFDPAMSFEQLSNILYLSKCVSLGRKTSRVERTNSLETPGCVVESNI